MKDSLPKIQPASKHQSNTSNPLKTPEGLFYNILSFTHPLETIEVNFSPISGRDTTKFSIDRLPLELQELMLKKGAFIPASVYTSFENKKSGYNVQVNLTEYPVVARAYYTRKIKDLLSVNVPFYRCNFLNDTQYWCSVAEQYNRSYTTYDKFTIRVQFDYNNSQPELLLSYDGHSFLLNQSLAALSDEMEPNTQMIETVAWRKRIYKWEKIPDEALYHHEEIYPVLNPELAEHLGWDFPFEVVSDKMNRFYNKVSSFYREWCSTAEFMELIPHKGHWNKAYERDTGRIKGTEGNLEFGEGRINTDPYQGIKLHGPLQIPKGRHFSYFFIYFEEQEDSARALYKYILKKEGFIKVSDFTRIPIQYDREKNIVILKNDDPEAKVLESIQKMSLDPNVKYFAFYVSPYTRFESDTKKKALYYRIKEQLLYRSISMQTVENHRLEKEFKYSVANIGIALVAKLGGVPWKLQGSNNKELIIGFGAYKTSTFGVRYTGSAVCFSHDGVFQEFDVFPAKNTRAIAGAAVDAFRNYREHNPDADRMIIHFFKKMSREELEPLERMLRDLKFDIPVIVAGISKTPSKSLLLFDNPKVNAMPVDGTWAKTGESDFLLNINLRKDKTDNKVKQTLPIKITLQCNREGYLEEEGTIEQLLQQIYAFSFLHWRSVRQAPLPVTVKYPAIIASFMPWFRDKNLTQFGRTVPWFL